MPIDCKMDGLVSAGIHLVGLGMKIRIIGISLCKLASRI